MLSRPSLCRYIAAVVIAVALAASLRAAQSPAPSSTPVLTIDGLGKGTAQLDGPWQFHVGDDWTWAQPGIDDATGQNGWEQVTTNAPLGTQGHPSFTGYGWYRKHITIST